jgi:hypothetical protein
MEELTGGRGVAEADQVTRFTSQTIAARNARVGAWVFIALGVGCVLFGGIFFAAKHSGHNVVAEVTHEGPCSNGTCTVDVAFDTADGQVSAVMYGVPSDEVYGPPSHRLLNINYQSADGSDPTTNDMPDAIWIGFGAAGLACGGYGAWLLRRKGSSRMLTAAAGGAAASAADSPVLTRALAGQPGPGGPARISGRGRGWVDDRSGTVTITERFSRWWAVGSTFLVVTLLGLVFADNFGTWLARGHLLAAVACLVAAGAAVIWGCSRAWRMGLRLGDDGVTVRNYRHTYRISWPEVLCFADGSVKRGEAGRVWALDIVLRDGRVVTASGTSRQAGNEMPGPRRWPRSGRPLSATRYRPS